jgi:hypothetical protein
VNVTASRAPAGRSTGWPSQSKQHAGRHVGGQCQHRIACRRRLAVGGDAEAGGGERQGERAGLAGQKAVQIADHGIQRRPLAGTGHAAVDIQRTRARLASRPELEAGEAAGLAGAPVGERDAAVDDPDLADADLREVAVTPAAVPAACSVLPFPGSPRLVELPARRAVLAHLERQHRPLDDQPLDHQGTTEIGQGIDLEVDPVDPGEVRRQGPVRVGEASIGEGQRERPPGAEGERPLDDEITADLGADPALHLRLDHLAGQHERQRHRHAHQKDENAENDEDQLLHRSTSNCRRVALRRRASAA